MFSLSLNSRTIVIITLAISFMYLAFPNFLWLIIIALLFIAADNIVPARFFVSLIIILLLTITSTISVSLREALQFSSAVILSYLFFRKFGLNFTAYRNIPKEIVLLLIVTYLAMIISTIFSDHVFLGIQQIIRLTIFLGIVYFIYSLTHDNLDIRWLLISLFIIGVIYAFIVIYELSQNNFNLIELNVSQLFKASSKYINMNSFGSFFSIALSILLSFILAKTERKKKNIFIALLLVMGAGLIISNSRAAILAAAVSSIFLLFMLNKVMLKRSLIIILIASPVIFIKPAADAIDIYLRLDRLSSGRDVIYDVTFNILKNNPILGEGPAGTKYAIYNNLDFLLGSLSERFIAFHYEEIEFGHAHNFYLFFWTDLGILGLIASILLPITFFKLCSRAVKKTKDFNYQYYFLSIGITAAGLGLFVRAFFEWGNLISYGTIGIDLPFWILIIILSYITTRNITASDKLF